MFRNCFKNLITVCICLSILAGCYSSNNIADFTDLPADEATEAVDAENIPETMIPDLNITNPKIIVKKSERLLYLLDGDTIAARFKIGLGFTPEGAKTQEGDGKTPEGEYYICTKNPNSRFYLSLGISYPNKEDANKALDEERIDLETYNEIIEAINDGKRPPWDTPLGGEIMIHGNGSSRDWTAGCIAVDNEVMDLLFEICDIGTVVIIE